MRKIMLAGVGAALMAIPTANAADMGRAVYKAPPPAVVPSLGRGATSEATSAAVGVAKPPLLRLLPRGFPSAAIPAALLEAVRLVAIINSHPTG